jgi:hypothetical protein
MLLLAATFVARWPGAIRLSKASIEGL